MSKHLKAQAFKHYYAGSMIVTVASFKGGVGKTTTVLHLATYLQRWAHTLLVDGDLNRSALGWAERGELPFKVVDEKQGIRFGRSYEHIVIDTPARPAPDELKTVAEGCDLLVLPTTPDALSLEAMLEMTGALRTLDTSYRILLTLVPPSPSKAGSDARQTIAKAELPLFQNHIRRLAVFQKAALEGRPVCNLKAPYAHAAWRCYCGVGKEILDA